MPLQPGARLGPYEVLSALGAGGMGEVYRARDPRLGRDVAIKVLPESFATDPDRLARFAREAKTLAALNHPNIAHIHGLEESPSAGSGQAAVRALVMELVEGEDLAQRIARGPIPLEDALPIARQIAEALEAAHEQGIIHRDLKPANIKVRDDGTVKVLDFGLAKALDPVGRDFSPAGGPAGAAGSKDPAYTNSPTITSPAMMTGAGMILGTAAYMAPEQARGKAVDKRADIWAFGCVLYEMLTGKPAFDGEDLAEILSRVLQRQPDWTKLPAGVPSRVSELLRLCLEKNVKNRRSDATDVRLDIEQALKESGQAEIPTAVPPTHSRLAWIVAAAATMIAALFAIPAARYIRDTPTPPPEMRLQIALPPGAPLTSFALSPDGLKLVFESQRKLWLRSLDSETVQPLAGTDRSIGWAHLPFWSPDSQSVGFFADSRLKRIDLSSGVVRTVADLPGFSGMGGAWNSAGTIVFAPSSDGSPLYRVSADGGDASPVTRLESGHRTHRYPQFLPDGQHFIFFARTTDGQGIYLGSLDSLETRRLLDSDGSAVFAPPDYVLFGRKGALLAQRFDLKEMMPRGNPISVAGQVAGDRTSPNNSMTGSLAISASTNGVLAYRSSAGGTQLVWLDRSGREIGRVGDADEGQPGRPSLSPDQSTLALGRTVAGNTDIWLFDVKQGLPRRFTTGTAWDEQPIWSPDGRQIVFASSRKGVLDLYMKSVDGNDETPLLESADGKGPTDWSSDGRFLLYHAAGLKTADDLWALPLFGDRKPFVVVQTPIEECCGRFSPDGRWISYSSDETGRREVYVQSFPGAAGRLRISTNGGGTSNWRSDGRELFYLEPGGQVMGVPVRMEGTTLRPGSPVALFRTPGAAIPSRDGQRFLIFSVIEEPSPITILLNWKRPTE